MQRFTAIIISALLLFSSSGVTYAQHFCGDHLMQESLSLGKVHLSCGMQQMADPCEVGSSEPMGCCDNEYTSLDTDDTLVKTVFSMDFEDLGLAIVPEITSFTVVTSQSNAATPFPCYRPPPDTIDFQVSYQCFLI